LVFVTTNNEVEYEAVHAGLSIARGMGITHLEIRSNSQVVVGQVNGSFAVQGDKLAKYLENVRQLQSSFDRVVLIKIPREGNVSIDALSQLGFETDQEIKAAKRRILFRAKPSISLESEVMQVDEEEPEWETGIICY
jgi:ribonuclease HI